MFRLFRSTREWIRDVALSPGTRVKISLGSADLEIRGGEPGKLRALVKYEVLPGEEARTEHILGHLLLREEEGELRVSLPRPLEFLAPVARVELPNDVELEIETGSGDIVLEGWSGKAQVVLGSGDLEVSRLQGTVFLRSGSGDVDLVQVYGALELTLASGDVSGQDVRGSLRVKTSSGDINLAGFQGDLDVSTGSGDVAVEGVPEEGREWRVRTNSGDVQVKVPKETELALDLTTSSGDISCSLPLVVEVRDEKRLKGQLGPRPTGSLRVTTGSGDIVVGEKHGV